jgi:hypothetical protein
MITPLPSRSVRLTRASTKRSSIWTMTPRCFVITDGLELDRGLGWKAEVEAALERLLESAQLQQPVGAGALSTPGCGHQVWSANRFRQ